MVETNLRENSSLPMDGTMKNESFMLLQLSKDDFTPISIKEQKTSPVNGFNLSKIIQIENEIFQESNSPSQNLSNSQKNQVSNNNLAEEKKELESQEVVHSKGQPVEEIFKPLKQNVLSDIILTKPNMQLHESDEGYEDENEDDANDMTDIPGENKLKCNKYQKTTTKRNSKFFGLALEEKVEVKRKRLQERIPSSEEGANDQTFDVESYQECKLKEYQEDEEANFLNHTEIQVLRSLESPKQKGVRLEKQRLYQANKRSLETDEERHHRLARDKNYKQETRQQEEPDQRSIRLALNAQRMREKRALETAEQRAYRLRQNALRMREKRAAESQDQQVYRLAINAERMREIRSTESDDQKTIRLALAAKAKREKRAADSQEQRILQLAINAQRMREKRARESKEQRTARLAHDAKNKREKRASESPEQRAKRLAKDSERMRSVRRSDSQEQQILRLAMNAKKMQGTRRNELDDINIISSYANQRENQEDFHSHANLEKDIEFILNTENEISERSNLHELDLHVLQQSVTVFDDSESQESREQQAIRLAVEAGCRAKKDLEEFQESTIRVSHEILNIDKKASSHLNKRNDDCNKKEFKMKKKISNTDCSPKTLSIESVNDQTTNKPSCHSKNLESQNNSNKKHNNVANVDGSQKLPLNAAHDHNSDQWPSANKTKYKLNVESPAHSETSFCLALLIFEKGVLWRYVNTSSGKKYEAVKDYQGLFPFANWIWSFEPPEKESNAITSSTSSTSGPQMCIDLTVSKTTKSSANSYVNGCCTRLPFSSLCSQLQVFKFNDLKKNIDINGYFHCGECEQNYTDIYRFGHHLLAHIELTSKYKHKCDLCNINFRLRRHSREHMVRHTGQRRHECPNCFQNFSTKKYLDDHMLTHSGITTYICDYCGKNFSREIAFKAHVQRHIRAGSYTCDTCGKSFTSNHYLKQHSLLHTVGKTFFCEICGKSYVSKESLTQHQKSHAEKKHKCDFCDYRCAYKANLRTHMLQHLDIKPFLCDICGKGLTTKMSLEQHYCTHTGERPFTCDICSRGFYNKSAVLEHEKIHSSEKMHGCEICGKMFAQRRGLEQHVLIHKRHNMYMY